MIYTKEILVKYETDVLVAGGGPAGVAAALAAARSGKRVHLIENNGCFGGSGTTALVPAFCQFTDGVNNLCGGIGNEVRTALFGEENALTKGFFGFPVEALKKLYDRMVTAEPNITFTFFTRLIDAVSTDGHVDHVVLAAKSGIYAVKAKIYIDCTGDGDLCAFAGAGFELGNEEGITMPSTLCSLWANIDYSRRAENNKPTDVMEKAITDGVFSLEDRHLPGIFKTDIAHGIGGGNVGHCFAVDATDEVSLTGAMLRGRSYMPEYERFYKEYVGGAYENMYLCYTADMLGIRESRRVTGEYRLCGEDFLRRAVFEDEIGRYAYPVDIHIMKPSKEAYDSFQKEYGQDMRYGVGESYGIPYRALIPRDLENVLVAGRCISTDRQMQASVRVMPGCYVTGQAAGVAAALACEKEATRGVKTADLQRNLKALGAYLPHAEV